MSLFDSIRLGVAHLQRTVRFHVYSSLYTVIMLIFMMKNGQSKSKIDFFSTRSQEGSAKNGGTSNPNHIRVFIKQGSTYTRQKKYKKLQRWQDVTQNIAGNATRNKKINKKTKISINFQTKSEANKNSSQAQLFTKYIAIGNYVF